MGRVGAAVRGGWSREAQACKLEEANAYQGQAASERQAAAAAGVARSTLRHWRERQERMDLAPEAVAFFETAVGVELLHRVVMAAQVVITLLGGGGIRLVCQFLELSGLAAGVAASYGSQQPVAMAVETAVVAFGERERSRLGAAMPARTISLCEDETFHPEVCLVALEPVSNFIVLEGYAQGRSAAQWQEKLAAALKGLAVRIIQVASDQAKGLCHHVTRMLGARQTPDLFHVQQDISRATAAVLAGQARRAEPALAEAEQALQARQAAQAAYEQGPRPAGRPPDFARRLDQAQWDRLRAQVHLEQVQGDQAEAKAVRRELSAAYHPYDLTSGQVQTPEQLSKRLSDCWQRLEALAQGAALPERCRGYLRKAQRLSQALVASVNFYFSTVTAKVKALNLPLALEAVLYERLIPAVYLDRVADRSADPEQRQALRQQARTLLAPLQASDAPCVRIVVASN